MKKKLKELKASEKLGLIKGDLIMADIEVESFNRQYAKNYDGYILTPENGRTTRSFLYGFNGLPLDDSNAYLVTVFYR